MVEDDGKKRLINFSPDKYEIMWAPCLWDYWESNDSNIRFFSFALITNNPPPEVQAKGHDRCPIFLKENRIDNWLNIQGQNKKDIYNLLDTTQEVYFNSMWAS